MTGLAALAALSLWAGDLHVAVRAGDRAAVEKLLDAGVSPNERDALGGTPLHDAAWAGDMEIAQLLIARGAQVNARHREAGSTPLHYAVITNHKALVILLIEKGADVNAVYQSGSTPLHLAANRGYLDIAALLLEHGAGIDQPDATGATALEEASWKGQAQTVSMLLKHHAKPTPKCLLLAAQKGHADVVKLMLAAGVSRDVKDSDGQTSLALALKYRQRAAAEALFAAGAELNAARRQSALKESVMRGETEMVELLLAHGGDAGSVLHDAALKGQAGVVKLLLARGAKVDARNQFGSTALHDAALGGHAEVVEVLLARGADPNAVDMESGGTPLHLAASYGRREVVALLLAKGADARLRNRAGKTPRELAVEAQQEETAALLKSR